MEHAAKTHDLLALLLSREAHGGPSAAVLEPLVAPFGARRMAAWLVEAVLGLMTAEFAQRTRPLFWQRVEGRGGDVGVVLAATREAAAQVDVFAGRLQRLAGVLKGAVPPEWSAAEALVPLLFDGEAAALQELLRGVARASFAAFEARELQTQYMELAGELERLNLSRQLSVCAVAAAQEAIEARLEAAARSWDVGHLATLLQWMETDVFPWLGQLLRGDNGPHRLRLWREALMGFCRLRAQELFDIVVGFPEETLVAVNDIKDCVVHLLALPTSNGDASKGGALEELQQKLGASLKSRLLHPGANTSDIVRTYMLCIHVLRIVDPSGVTLDRVSGPVRAYLVGRSDTIRCIVQSLTDPAGDLFSELSKAPSDAEALQRATAPENWTPEPADSLPQSEGVSRHKDVVELLINIFGGSEPFVAEFKSLMGQRLLAAAEYDAEIRTLELLKLRFGENSLNDCEVMLRDMADSKRVNKLCAEEGSDFAATIVSHLYWPQLPAALELVPSPSLLGRLERFQKAFAEKKASRKLQWNLALGEVALDIKLPSGRVLSFDSLSFVQATLLELFQGRPVWQLAELAKEMGLSGNTEAVRRGLQYWAGTGLMREEQPGEWRLRLEDGDVHVASGADMMEESDEDGEDDMAGAEPFVLHMLNNLGALSLSEIHDQLKSFADIDAPPAVLKEFLAGMVAAEKIDIQDGRYRGLGK